MNKADMVMDYRVAFGKNVDFKMVDGNGLEFNSDDPMKDFEYYAENLRFCGVDYSDHDYVALYRNNEGFAEMMAIKVIK